MYKPGKGLTLETLKTRIAAYVKQVTGRSSLTEQPKDVFISATIPLDVLLRVAGSTPHCGGIRIYLTKSEDGIWPVIVPVSQPDAHGVFTDIVTQTTLDNADFEWPCRNPPCVQAFRGTTLLPGYK
jgi:hypothetical protein